MVLRISLILSFLLSVCALPSVAQPLLVEGTNTVYQRVLTRPSAPLYAAVDGSVIEDVPAFQPYYVFGENNGWIEAGPSVARAPVGWFRGTDVV
ncbi:MAG: VWA domain-containing protein, partial [Pseudomonadota bacterium]